MKRIFALALVFIGTVVTWAVLNFKEEVPVPELTSEATFLEVEENVSAGKREEQPSPRAPQYDILLEFQPTQNQLLGNSSITVWNRSDAPTNQIFVNLFLNAFKDGKQPVLPEFMNRAYPSGIQHGSMDIQNVTVDGGGVPYKVKGTSLIVSLNDSWDPGEKRGIQIEWTASLPQIHHRVGMNNDAYWFGNVLPILAVFDGTWAVYDYQAVGDPFFSEAADYKLEVTMPAAYHLYSTGNETEVTTNQSRIVTIEASQVREMAFAITANHDLETISTKSGVQVNLYYRNASKSQAETTVKRRRQC